MSGYFKHTPVFDLFFGWAVAALVSALLIPGCKKDGITSRVIEFCTPLAAIDDAEGGFLPHAAAVINPGPAPPPGDEVLDLLIGTEYPFTTIDASTYARIMGNGFTESGSFLESMNLAVVDNRSGSNGESDSRVMGRAIFENFPALITGIPPLGPEGNFSQHMGILGGDLLRRYAVRLHYGSDPECVLPWNPESRFPTITFMQEYSDNDRELARDGFAVMKFTLAGGGRMLFNNKRISFGATRVTAGACVEPAPFSAEDMDPDSESIYSMSTLEEKIPVTGRDAMLLVSTGTTPLVLGESFFAAVEAAGSNQDPPVNYPSTDTTMSLMEGRVTARAVSLNRVALLGSVSGDLSPCRELALRRRIAWVRHWLPQSEWTEGEFRINKIGAPVAEYDAQRNPETPHPSLAAYVVSDNTKLLEGLRFETTEQIPSIDGIVGHEFLKNFELIIDYPGQRLLFRCLAYKPPENSTCGSSEDLETSTCCDRIGRCSCPSLQPCCQYTQTRRP